MGREVAAGGAQGQRAVPAVAVAADQVEGHERAVVEAAAEPTAAEGRHHETARGVGVVERAEPGPPGAEDGQVAIALPGGARHGGRPREVRRRGGPRRAGALRGEERPGPVGRAHHHGAAGHGLGRHLQRAVPEVEPGDPLGPALAGEHRVGAEVPGQAPGVLGVGHRDDGARAGVHGRAHRGGGAQHVEHQHRASGEVARGEAERGEEHVEPHRRATRGGGGAPPARGTWCPPSPRRSRDGG